MRVLCVALFVVAACAAPEPPVAVYTGPLSPEAEANRQRHNAAAEDFLAMQRRFATATPAEQRAMGEAHSAAAQAAQASRAAIVCRARGNLAATQPAFGGFGLVGGIAAGMQQAWAGSNAEAICIDTYRATGIMPAY